MKLLFIFVGIVLVLFIVFQVFWTKTNAKIEDYPYQVLKKFDELEIRRYDARLFMSVKLNSSEYKEASKKGFSKLANYIFGGNKEGKKISMTSPVSISLEDSMTMMFMVPSEYKKGMMPKPNISDIKFKEEPSKHVAVVTFGGWASDESIETNKNRLIDSLRRNNIQHTGKFYFLGYNPPFEVFNRKNEIMVELSLDLIL